MNYLIIAAVLLAFFTLTFIWAQIQKNNGLVDIAWGLGFVITSGMSFLVGRPLAPVPLVMSLCVAIWGIRLTWHLARRNIGKPEDFRYKNMRNTWKPSTFYIRMFVQIYIVQLVLNYVINLTTIVTNLEDQITWGVFASFGLAVWMIGFAFEAIGDMQLKRFRSRADNRGKLMTSGLWKYSRHPNYFGEATQWWGLYFMAVSGGRYYWLIISPLLITLFLLYVSGVPLLEKKYSGRADWEEYKNKTSKFFPWFPGKRS